MGRVCMVKLIPKKLTRRNFLKVKSRVFVGLGIGVLVGVLALLLNSYSTEFAADEISTHDEADFSNEAAMEELDPEDRWMLKFIDPPTGVSPKDVYAFDCETVEIKPEALSPYCADFGVAVWKIKWSKWGAYGAEGKGIFAANDCDPNCAEGNYLKVPVKLFLSDLVTNGRDYFFSTATIYPANLKDQSGPIVGKSGNYFTGTAVIEGREVSAENWDIGSDFRTNPDLRMDLP